MSDSPWFPFYVGDFLSATAHMEPEQVGVYVRLLCAQWSTGRVPIEDQRALCRVCGIFPEELAKYSEFISQKFPGGQNPRLQKERKKRETRSANGKLGGRPKADGKANQKLDGKLSESPEKANPKASQLQSQSQSDTQTDTPPPTPPEGGTGVGVLDEPVRKIMEAAGVRRWPPSRTEIEAFANHPALLRDPESVSTIEGAVGTWKANQEALEGRQQPVSIAEIGRRLTEIWDWADSQKRKPKNGNSRSRYQSRDDLMKA